MHRSAKALLLFFSWTSIAHATGSGALVNLLGPHAQAAFAPTSGQIGACISLPPGVRAESLGLDSLAPGIGRLRASPSRFTAFVHAHPELHMEVSPPLHLLLDRLGTVTRASGAHGLGVDGSGVLVGIADTGLDVSHPDFRDSSGKTRVAWMLDLSMRPRGVHADLEKTFGVLDDLGNVVYGAVFDSTDLNTLLKSAGATLPGDQVGHGSHVASIAAGGGGGSPYIGVAPAASLVIVRITRSASAGIENDDLLRGVDFLFNRADALNKPIAVNLSLGSDWGPHDGTTLWEQVLANYLGPTHPGHALVVAAGNSGSIALDPVHQTVSVSRGQRARVPITTYGAADGGVQVWITRRGTTSLDVGLDGPDGEWIAPVAVGTDVGVAHGNAQAGIINGRLGSSDPSSEIPAGSNSAIVLWQGSWPEGTYWVTFEGEGTVELYVQGTGDSASDVGFRAGVREGTINLPGTHPSILAVGCTVNKPSWTSQAGGKVKVQVPVLDDVGGLPLDPAERRSLVEGEICAFSSAGPNAKGVAKPEIAAPGSMVVAALSQQALPGSPYSDFTTSNCPSVQTDGGLVKDPNCLQVDPTHAVAQGTSMSSPAVAGAAALLFQRDPTLTQGEIVALLQAGAHPFRGPAPFQDQSGPGELDVVGALDALDQMRNPVLALPSRAASWLTLSADMMPGDGSRTLTAIVELRTEGAVHRADLFDPTRLNAWLRIGNTMRPVPPLVRKAPGLWTLEIAVEPGLGGSSLTVGATFDGQDIVEPRTVPIATDPWTARYPSRATGGSCQVVSVGTAGAAAPWMLLTLSVGRRRWKRGLAVSTLAALLLLAGCKSKSTKEGPAPTPTLREPRSGPALAVVDLSAGVPEQPQSGILAPQRRSFDDLLRTLDRIQRDKNSKAVFVRFGGASIGLARAVELGDALAAMAKPVHCHADSYSNSTLYVAARACTRITLSPAGEVEAVGLAAQVVYMRRLLVDHLGLSLDILQVGKFKGAEEPITRDGPSNEARASLESTLGDLRATWLAGIRVGRPKLEEHWLEDGPYTPGRAKERGLIDDIAYDDDARNAAKKASGAVREEARFGAGPQSPSDELGDVVRLLAGEGSGTAPIALVRATGSISLAGGGAFGASGITHKSLSKILASVEKDDGIKVLVLRIDSPGGSALASDLLWHSLMRVRARKPIVISVGEMAASGGYYLASTGTAIVAQPTSILGSIGVVGGKVGVGKALERIGMHVETFPAKKGDPGAANRAAYMSPLTPWDAATRARVLEAMTAIYRLFLSRVVEGRAGKLTLEALEASAEGRIFSGREAKDRGLIDELGGLSQAIAKARSLASLPDDARVAVMGQKAGMLDSLADGDSDEETMAKTAGAMAFRALVEPIGDVAPFAEALLPLAYREHAVVALPFAVLVH